MTTWHMCFACWVDKATNTRSQYLIHTAFPLQQWLHEGAPMLRYKYDACLVITDKESVYYAVRTEFSNKIPHSRKRAFK